MHAPYDPMQFPNAPPYLATYGSQPLRVEALVRVQRGKVKPQRRLPFELPGLYKLGDGLSAFR